MRSGLKAGPYRFTMSRSGMAVTAEVPGFRAKWAPRGYYVHLTQNRIYYRGTPPRRSGPGAPARRPDDDPAPDSIPLEEVPGATVRELVPTAPHDLIVQLRTAAARLPWWPFVLAVLLIAALLLGRWGLLLVAAGAPLVAWVALRDRAVRTVAIMYDVNGEAARRFDAIVRAVEALRQADGLWQVTEVREVWTPHHSQVNAGASTVLSRRPATVTMDGPRHLVTNIAVPTLVSGREAVHFLPDRILVRRGNAFAAFPYRMVEFSAESIRFIERGLVPEDAEITGTTWRFVAADGGPDPHLKYNRQLPVLRYGRLTLRNDRGVHLVWDASQAGLVHAAAQVLAAAAAARPPVVHGTEPPHRAGGAGPEENRDGSTRAAN